MTRQNKHRDIPMHICKAPQDAPPPPHLALGLFQHKEPTHPSLMAEKTQTFMPGSVVGTWKDAMVSDLRFSESNEKDHQGIHFKMVR